MSIDPNIPLAAGAGNPFNPLGAQQAGIAMQQGRQNLVSGQQMQQLRGEELQSSHIDNLVRQRALTGTQAYARSLAANTDYNDGKLVTNDQKILNDMQGQGYYEFADLHRKRMGQAATEEAALLSAQNKVKAGNISRALTTLNNIDLTAPAATVPSAFGAAPETIIGGEPAAPPPEPGTLAPSATLPQGVQLTTPKMAPQGPGVSPETYQPQQVGASGQAQYSAALAQLDHMGFDTSEFPTIPTPETLAAAKQRLNDELVTMERAGAPSEVAAREAETRLHTAQAGLAEGETAFYKGFGGAKLPPEVAMSLQTAAKQSFGKNFVDLSDSERALVFGRAKDMLETPEQRMALQQLISSRATTQSLNNLLLKSLGVGGVAGGGASGTGVPVIDSKIPDLADPASMKPVPEWGGFTPQDVYQNAMRMLATGSAPGGGFGSNPVAKMQALAVQHKASQIAADAGMTMPEFTAFYKANAASLTTQVKSYDTVAQLIRTADMNSLVLDKAVQNVPDIGAPIFNQPLRDFAKKYEGDTAMSTFAASLRSVSNEYARVLQGSATGGGSGVLSDSSRREAEQLVAPDSTVQQMMASLATLRQEGGNRMLSIGEQVRQIQQRLSAGPKAGLGGDTAATPTVEKDPGYMAALQANPGKAVRATAGPFKGQRWTWDVKLGKAVFVDKK